MHVCGFNLRSTSLLLLYLFASPAALVFVRAGSGSAAQPNEVAPSFSEIVGDGLATGIHENSSNSSKSGGKKGFNNKRKIAKGRKEGGSSSCEYERGEWQECQNGVQQRISKLKPEFNANKCELIKTVRRNCVKGGCKYVRGDWSATCQNGLRTREDTLLPGAGQVRGSARMDPKTNSSSSSSGCPLKRRVTRDCRRACHYLKSPWSECQNGFKTRNLTLEEKRPTAGTTTTIVTTTTLTTRDTSKTPANRDTRSTGQEKSPMGEHNSNPVDNERLDNCKRSILIRRQCSSRPGKRRQTSSNSIQQAATAARWAGSTPNPAINSKAQLRQQQQQHRHKTISRQQRQVQDGVRQRR